MKRSIRNLLLAGFATLAPLAEANAQALYPAYGYGYGYGYRPAGWYAGASTAPGDYLQGSGLYLQGLGRYLFHEAMADQIQSNRLGLENEYGRFLRWTIMHDATLRRQMLTRRNVLAREAIESRKLDRPTSSDLYLGDSLNILLGTLTAPGTELPTSLLVDIRLSADLVLCLPLHQSPTEPAVCLRDVDRAPLPPNFQALVIEADPLRFSSLRRTIRDRDGISLLDLVEFMRDFRLRFGKAEEPSQRAAFTTLHRELSRFRPTSSAPNADANADEPGQPALVRR